MPETQYAEMFLVVGRRYSLNPRLLASIASAESGFEPWAILYLHGQLYDPSL